MNTNDRNRARWQAGAVRNALKLAVFTLGFAGCFCPGSMAADEPVGWRFQEEPLRSFSLVHDDQVVWQINYSSKEPKPYFHPVALPGGPVLTWNRPPDHVWHHGLWFSWKYLNGVNYWEPNPNTGQSDGRWNWDIVRLTKRPDHTARIQLDLKYRPPDQAVVLTETRVIEISRPDETGRYHFDWTSKFTAGEKDVEFGRTPIPGQPGGKPWGGYAGLSVRLAKDFTDRKAVNAEGPIDFGDGSTHRSKSTALDYSGLIDGRPVGIAVCDHPANVNHPSPWYAIAGKPMSYFSPAVICYAPHTLPAGESLELKYRVIVHPGRWDAAKLQEEFDEFANATNSQP